MSWTSNLWNRKPKEPHPNEEKMKESRGTYIPFSTQVKPPLPPARKQMSQISKKQMSQISKKQMQEIIEGSLSYIYNLNKSDILMGANMAYEILNKESIHSERIDQLESDLARRGSEIKELTGALSVITKYLNKNA